MKLHVSLMKLPQETHGPQRPTSATHTQTHGPCPLTHGPIDTHTPPRDPWPPATHQGHTPRPMAPVPCCPIPMSPRDTHAPPGDSCPPATPQRNTHPDPWPLSPAVPFPCPPETPPHHETHHAPQQRNVKFHEPQHPQDTWAPYFMDLTHKRVGIHTSHGPLPT